MNMGIGINARRLDEGELNRPQEEVACGVWFTSTGDIMPKKLKYRDSEGGIHSIDQIRVLWKESRRYCGIPVWEYCCRTVYENREYLFRLYYYTETGCWKLSWGG